MKTYPNTDWQTGGVVGTLYPWIWIHLLADNKDYFCPCVRVYWPQSPDLPFGFDTQRKLHLLALENCPKCKGDGIYPIPLPEVM